VRIEHDMPMREYQRQPELSASDVKAINSNPHRWFTNRGHERVPTPAMILGSAVHAMILGDDHEVVALDVSDFKTIAARQAKAAALDEGKYPLTIDQHEQATAMAKAVRENPDVKPLIASGKSEVSFFSEHEATGQPIRGRVDRVDVDACRIVDFKTSDSAYPEKFVRQAGRMNYHVSAANYGDAWGHHAGTAPWEVLFVVIERDYPYTCSVVKLGPSSLDLGRRAFTRGIHTYRQASMTGSWGTPWPGITTVELPKYEFYAEDER